MTETEYFLPAKPYPVEILKFADDPGIYRLVYDEVLHQSSFYWWSRNMQSWAKSTVYRPGVHQPQQVIKVKPHHGLQ